MQIRSWWAGRRALLVALAVTVVATAVGAVTASPSSADVGSAAAAAGSPAAVVDHGSRFFAVDPARLLDSRGPLGGFGGPVGAGETKLLTVAGVDPVGADATAVVLNVTVTGATAGSYLTVAPAGTAPNAASLLFAPGQTTSNLVTVGVGAGGQVGFFNQLGSVEVIADVVGWFGPSRTGDLFRSATPTRVLDSRGDVGGWTSSPLGPGERRDLAVAGVGEVPDIAEGVVLNVTVTGGSAASFLRVSPSDAADSSTANLLFAAGQTTSNLVMVGLGGDGGLSIFNQLGTAHVIVDLVGWFDHSPGGSGFFATTPARLVDDRSGIGVTGPWTAGANRSVPLAPAGPVPADATAVVANLTATGGTEASYLSVGPTPATVPPPNANLLFAAGQTVPNAVVAPLGASGQVDVFNQQGEVHVIADVSGWFGAPDERRTPYDFDGDGTADSISTSGTQWRNPIAGTFLLSDPSATDAVPGDYDGDGRWDMATYHADGSWVTRSKAGTLTLARPTIPGSPVGVYVVPVPGDYDGDGRTDPAWYDESNGTWTILGQDPVVFGSGPSNPASLSMIDRTDQPQPAPGDYDGDGRTDLAYVDVRTFEWSVRRSSDGVVDSFVLGNPNHVSLPAPADYDGVGHDQPAMHDGTVGTYVRGHDTPLPVTGGATTDDFPAMGDYLGLGTVQSSAWGYKAGDTSNKLFWFVPGEPTGTTVELLSGTFPVESPMAQVTNIARLTLIARCVSGTMSC